MLAWGMQLLIRRDSSGYGIISSCSSMSGVATHSGCIMDWAAQVKESSIRQLLCRQHCAVPNEARPADEQQNQDPHTNREPLQCLERQPKVLPELPYMCIPDR